MKLEKTPVRDVFTVDLDPHEDARGLFVEGFVKRLFEKAGIALDVQMANMSVSRKAGTVRGMHWQAEPFAQGKLVFAAAGRIFDAVVDVRPGSASFGESFGVELVPQRNALYAAPGVAHGWQALSDGATLLYLVDGPWKPRHERGLRYDDPDAAIRWPLPPIGVAPKDLSWPSLKEVRGASGRDLDEAVRSSAGSEVCICERDSDGRCPDCVEKICDFMGELVDRLVRAQRQIEALNGRKPELCDVCEKETADYALAKFAKDFAGNVLGHDGSHAPLLAAALNGLKTQFGNTHGVRHFPLVDKMIADILSKRPEVE